MAETPPSGGLQVKASDAQLRGQYSSHMQVLHTREEFILDFMLVLPPQAQLVARVLMSPSHVKRMLRALNDNLSKYEKQFGRIEPGDRAEEPREVGFRVE